DVAALLLHAGGDHVLHVLDRGVALFHGARFGVADLHQRLAVALLGGGHALVERFHGRGLASGQGGGVEGQEGEENGGGKGGPAGRSDDKGVHEVQVLRREATRRVASRRGARQPPAFARIRASSARATRWTPFSSARPSPRRNRCPPARARCSCSRSSATATDWSPAPPAPARRSP